MGRIAKELSAVAVKRLTDPGMHFVGGVPGLALLISSTGSRSWILRVMVSGKRRDIGIGSFNDFSLGDAREKSRECRKQVLTGVDPVEQKQVQRLAALAEVSRTVTFDECAKKYIEAQSPGWNNSKHIAQWTSTLKTYASPVVGMLSVAAVDTPHVLKILEPIWAAKTETATRVRQRIEKVLDWATVSKFRSGENPARWRGHLDNLLAKPSRVATVKNHPALPFAEIGNFMVALRGVDGMGARALEFAILTAARSGEVREATWGEFDLAANVWTIPAERMKASKEHRVALSPAAVRLLKGLPREDKAKREGIVFPAPRGGALSDMTLTALIRRMDKARRDAETKGWLDPDGRVITAHGFRATFKTWAGEKSLYPRDVIEHALAHQLKDKSEAAYERGTMFEKRCALMRDWGKFAYRVKKAASVRPVSRKAVA